jgi:hypothetical protein
VRLMRKAEPIQLSPAVFPRLGSEAGKQNRCLLTRFWRMQAMFSFKVEFSTTFKDKEVDYMVNHYYTIEGEPLICISGLEIFIRHVSPDALPDALEQSNLQCHPNTRIAVLKDILSWVEDDKSETQVLWLDGPAGAGKTAIGHSVAEQAKQQFAAGFFFSRTEAGRNHDKCLIATISYQLRESIPEARPFIEAAVTKDPLIFLRSLNSQIKHLIIDPLNQMPAGSHYPHPKLLLIDGLDECIPTGSQKNILAAIHTAFQQGHFPFRVLICSRAEPDIREVFESKLAKLTYRISLDDKKYESDQDIALYLRSKFSDIGRKLRYKRGAMSSSPLPSWPSEKVIQTLVSKASGQFIYAATVIRYVDVRDERPDDRLKIVLGLSGSQSSKPFDELDSFYRKIFSAIKDISLTSRLLGTILTLKTPLSIDSLENLLEEDAEPALCYLHSVVRIPDSNTEGPHMGIGLYHASLGDFLFDPDRAGVYHITKESAHATLAESCLRILSVELIPRWTTSNRRDMITMDLRGMSILGIKLSLLTIFNRESRGRIRVESLDSSFPQHLKLE